jgi:hypothetical protein
MRRCLRCNRTFQPSKEGHRFCSPDCRHRGPRQAHETPPPNETVIDELFNPERDENEIVKPTDWHPGPDDWRELDAYDTVKKRRRWYLNLVAEGMI